jgi:hypothetical protein
MLKLSEWEAEAVRQAMIAARGNLTRAADMLGVGGQPTATDDATDIESPSPAGADG